MAIQETVVLFFAALLLWAPHVAESCPEDSCSESCGSGDVDDDVSSSYAARESSASVYDYTVKDIDGNDVCMDQYRGKVLIIVNYAECCTFTEDNVQGLSKLANKYADKDCKVLVFPSNDFSQNVRGNEAARELQNAHPEFCVFSEVHVNDGCEEPLYTCLKETVPGPATTKVEWNFTKFLVNRNGCPVERYTAQDDFECIDTSVNDLCCEC